MKDTIRAAGAMALAAAPACAGMFGVVPAGAATAASAPVRASMRTCATEALSPTELAAGAISAIACDDTPDGAAAVTRLAQGSFGGAAALGSTLLATHFSGTNGSGSLLTVYGSACDGSGLNLSAGDWWNDKIVSTRHAACPNVKHWVDAGYSGDAQITQGAYGDTVNLNATLARNVSSVRYYGS